jgi:hypothetical protein
MTPAEVEQTLQQVALSIQQLTQLAARSDERHDEADERIEALINAQVRYEARQEALEESFRQVAESNQGIVRMLALHEERPDGQDKEDVHTESRLDALIDSQIQLTARVDTLTSDVVALSSRIDRIGGHLDRVAVLQGENAKQISVLIAAQARTDELIRLLIERNGSKGN